MTTNTIIPPPAGIQLGQPQTAEHSTKADAWRKAFEKEQAGIIKNTKSIKLGKSTSTESNNDMLDTKRGSLSAQGAERSEKSNKAELSVSKSTFSTQFGKRPMNALYFQPATRSEIFLAQSFPPISTSILPTRPLSLATNHNDIRSTITFLESHYKQKWPLKNVHVLQSDNGVSVWIRDISLDTDESAVQKVILRMKQCIEADGHVLVSFVVNGKTISK